MTYDLKETIKANVSLPFINPRMDIARDYMSHICANCKNVMKSQK